ncbi:MAG: F0F1 ATP synthase subunit gamma [Candidatus Saccharimonadales bacterium]
MRRAISIQQELNQIHTIEDLTEVFESIASLHIAKVRNRVVASKAFFAELWPVYRSLRVDPKERLARNKRPKKGRNVLVAVTAEGKLGGETTEGIISELVAAYRTPDKTDVIAVGSLGTRLLHQHGITPTTTFSLPTSDISFDVGDMIRVLDDYDQIKVFYQTYESLRQQKVAHIDLVSAVCGLGEDVGEEGETVSSRDYIFEPGINEIADYMESVMMGVALTQIVMESKLAGYANRFNAMSRAKRRAKDLVTSFGLQYHRAKRAEGDERLKEITKVIRPWI